MHYINNNNNVVVDSYLLLPWFPLTQELLWWVRVRYVYFKKCRLFFTAWVSSNGLNFVHMPLLHWGSALIFYKVDYVLSDWKIPLEISLLIWSTSCTDIDKSKQPIHILVSDVIWSNEDVMRIFIFPFCMCSFFVYGFVNCAGDNIHFGTARKIEAWH